MFASTPIWVVTRGVVWDPSSFNAPSSAQVVTIHTPVEVFPTLEEAQNSIAQAPASEDHDMWGHRDLVWTVIETSQLTLPDHPSTSLILHRNTDGQMRALLYTDQSIVDHWWQTGSTLSEILLKMIYASIHTGSLLDGCRGRPSFPSTALRRNELIFLMNLHDLVADNHLRVTTRDAVVKWIDAAVSLADSLEALRKHWNSWRESDQPLPKSDPDTSIAHESFGFMVIPKGYPNNPWSIWPTQDEADKSAAYYNEQIGPDADDYSVEMVPTYVPSSGFCMMITAQKMPNYYLCAVSKMKPSTAEDNPDQNIGVIQYTENDASLVGALLKTLASMITGGIIIFSDYSEPVLFTRHVLVRLGFDLPKDINEALGDYASTYGTAILARRQALAALRETEGFVPDTYDS